MPEMYRSAFKSKSIRTRGDHVVHKFATQIITPCAGPLCRYRMQAADMWSPRSLQTRIRLGEYCMENSDTSKQTTLCHYCIQLCRLVHRHSLCCFIKGSRSNVRQADRLRCCKLRLTVRAETERAANMPISQLMALDMEIQFCRADLTIYLSSWTFMVRGRWHSAYHSVWPSAVHWFHICMTVDGCRPLLLAISRNDNPHSQ